ncbi:MAG: polysaccharide deacetylase family protein [Planctomycetota bacterium]
MNLPKFLIESRGLLNLARRLPRIFWRFGIGPGRMEKSLEKLLQITERYGVRPTLPVTAAPLRRHPGVIRRLQQRGVELALHGLVHTDYTALSREDHLEHMEEAAHILKSHGIRFWGARAPYMRANETTLEAGSQLHLHWDSNEVRAWDVLDDIPLSTQALAAYRKVLSLYDARPAADRPVIPRRLHDLVEIPVSLPDDEAMVDRLGLGRQPDAMARIWLRILQATHQRGDLFTIQLHHERVNLCGRALEEVLRQARLLKPGVWVAPLREITAWWKERASYRVQVSREQAGHVVTVEAGPRAVLQVRGGHVPDPGGWTAARDRKLLLPGSRKPIVGISEGSGEGFRSFLQDEGFPYEETRQPEDYAIAFDEPDPFPVLKEFATLARIECVSHPLVRLARWPSGARSALAVTGDIDALTIWDFFWRLKEV